MGLLQFCLTAGPSDSNLFQQLSADLLRSVVEAWLLKSKPALFERTILLPLGTVSLARLNSQSKSFLRTPIQVGLDAFNLEVDLREEYAWRWNEDWLHRRLYPNKCHIENIILFFAVRRRPAHATRASALT